MLQSQPKSSRRVPKAGSAGDEEASQAARGSGTVRQSSSGEGPAERAPQGDAYTILQGQRAWAGATVCAKDSLSLSCITFCPRPGCRHRFKPRLA